ncbi:cytochrome P450 [Cristinia sonorae]|uniref:Cytochrome P450 n=1 Tax=Cristinia sonorae TaxID=1940300 RepID=A0A8K0UHX6_9AGAR|nr:cytochrome P450 [Cristinia sonorae]
MSSSACFSSIPVELLYHIFRYISVSDIVNVLSVSSFYRPLVADETIWRDLCSRYGVHDLTSLRIHDPNRSYFTVYTQLLHAYGPLLGLWASDNPFQGNVIEFRVVTESREVGWEGIVGEVWRFPSFERMPMQPDYYEFLRIGFPTPSDGVEVEESSMSLRFTQVIHSNSGTFHNTTSLYQVSPSCLHLNAPHKQAFYLCDGPPYKSHKPSLHPRFPPPALKDLWYDPARLPRLTPHYTRLTDLQKFLRKVRWNILTMNDEHILYFAPANRGTTPQPASITIVPPYAEEELYDSLLSPQRDSSVIDIREEVPKAFTKSGARSFVGHYFSLPNVPRPPCIQEPSEETTNPDNQPSTHEDPDFRSLEGLWLGAYSSDGTTVLYLKWNQGSDELEAWKVTGGYSVPRGALSWTVHNSRPIFPCPPGTDESSAVSLVVEMGIKLESLDRERVLLFEGTGVIADEGFMEESRLAPPISVAIIGQDEIRIRWAYGHIIIVDSDIIFLDLPMRPVVILGSAKAASDLLEKKAHLYSDRVQSIMVKLMNWDIGVGMMPYTPRWRAHRRMFHQQFHGGVADKFRPIQRQYTREFLSWVLQEPANMRDHVRRLITAIIVSATYGKRITSMEDEYVTMVQTAVEGVNKAAIPGAFWIEFMPFLRYIPSWVPGTTSKRVAEWYKPYVIDMKEKPFLEVKTAVDAGSAPQSVTRTLIENISKNYGGTTDADVYEEIAKNVTSTAYAAGADTTRSACLSFLLATALFPEVQTRAQAELDRVVGPSRLPEYEDFAQMPYLQAIVLETMRWMAVTPLSIPHAVIEEDVYEGYRIPKGSMIIPNVWAMSHDEKDYPDPEIFKPERFLNADGNIDPTVRDPTTLAFGFGRRICLGRHFSNNTLSIFIASVLHVFNINAGVDASGEPVVLSTEMEGGLVALSRPEHSMYIALCFWPNTKR